MKSAAISGVKQAEIREVPEPQAGGKYVKVKVAVAPMCTEYKAYQKGTVTDSLGHEAAGTVAAVGRPGPFSPGDRVVVMPSFPCGVCRYCLAGAYIHCRDAEDPLAATGSSTGRATYAQYLLKSEQILIPVPDEMSLEHASMACCGLGPTFGAMQSTGVGVFDTVLITGLGPVGLGGVVNAIYRGARVIAVEGNPYRAELARSLGAEVVFDPADKDVLRQIMDLTDGNGPDMALDCSGVPAAQRLAIEAVRRLGTVCFVGEGGEVGIKVSDDMIRKGLVVRGNWHWNLNDTHNMMRMILEVGELLDLQITHRFPLEQVREAWELQLTGRCGKILLYPWQS